MADPSKMIEAAKSYVARGFRPIRLHGVTDGRCTCTKGAQPSHHSQAGKHPTEVEWQQQAMPTDDEIDGWFKGWRESCNIGIATGPESGFWVLDVDPERGGMESLRALQERYAKLEVGMAQKTGSGGFHLCFEWVDGLELGNSAKGLKDFPGLDVRAVGGQIVAAPSASAKGSYSWAVDNGVRPAPQWLIDLLQQPKVPLPPVARTPVAVELDDVEAQRLQTYTRTVVDTEIGRLDRMREAAGDNYFGEPWNTTTFAVACALLEVANSAWSTYTQQDAHRDLLEHAPRDDGFTTEDVLDRWASALTTVADRGRPYPPARPDQLSEVASWEGVRIDPLLVAAVGGAVPPTSVVAEDDTPREVPMRSWDDLGNAYRVVDHFGAQLRWVAEAESWAVYQGGQWALVKPPVVQGLVQKMLDELIPATEALLYSDMPTGEEGDQPSEREGFLKWLKAQRMSARIAAAQKEAAARPELAASIEDFDAHPLLLNVANGVVDLQTGTLLPHDPALRLMKQVPVSYDPQAPAPLWQRFLDRVQPDPEMQSYLQRILGYTISGSTAEQAYFLWHGDGRNGKSVVAGTISTLMASYGGTVAPGVLLASGQDQHPTGWAAMAGCRWLPATETAPGKRLEEEKIKEFTGGQAISARFMGKDFFSYSPVGKIHLITNHLPVLSATDSIRRRTHLLRWGVQIPLAEQDRYLEQKLRGELPGILAWLVRGCLQWQQQGLSAPQSALDDLATWLDNSDVFGGFLSERTMPAPGAKTPVAALYAAYTSWCFDTGQTRPMTTHAFSQTLEERKYVRYRTASSRGFCDVVPITRPVVPPAMPWTEEPA